jgi:hypothetical protein
VGKLPTSVEGVVRQFIEQQHVFFVATAPLAGDGHVNLSPKGLDSFRILGPTTVAYLDLTGSGVETIAHVRENRRIVIMFCAFQGPPKILRLHGLGRVVEPKDAEFVALQMQFPEYLSTRAIVVAEITRVSDSCGYGIPLMSYQGDRPQMSAWAEKKGIEGLKQYRRDKNRVSMDGLPGVQEL